MIKFNPDARRTWLNGFHLRKQARKWKGAEELLERERLDRIEAKKDHREGIKQRWRDVQRAGALTNKAFEQRGLMDESKRRRIEAVEDADSEDDYTMAAVKDKAPVTVAFAKEEDGEEDDPFGDCEVTTTAFGASSSGGSVAANASKLWPALLHTNITSAWTGGSDTWAIENADEDELAAAKFARQRRRVVVRVKEEKRQYNALQRRVGKKIAGASHRNKKGSKAKKKNSEKKSTHSSRKKNAQAGARKSGKGKKRI